MMKSLSLAGAFGLLLSLAGSALAVVNAPVNIAYPIQLNSYDNYIKVAFSVTCPGGPNSVKWGFDGSGIGGSSYYDNFNSQFLHKLPTGWHTFEVSTNCGQDRVQFYVN